MVIFGYLIGIFICDTNIPLREGARTLPRPVINPEYDADWDMPKAPAYVGETMNQMIDRNINDYFDVTGLPFAGTIQLYETNCVNKGPITVENQQNLTDIGYYIINIVISNIQTADNPTPTVSWPPIKWTNDKIFDILYQKVPTYELYVGQPLFFSNGSYLSSTANNVTPGSGSGSGSGSTGSGSTGSGSGNGSGGDGEKCDDETKCGTSCPDSCLSSIASAWEKQQLAEQALSQVEQDARDQTNANTNTNAQWGGGVVTGSNPMNQSNAANRYANGITEIYGYKVTNIINTTDSSTTTLNDSATAFINKYFIKDGANKNKPTKDAIDLFNAYFQYKTPMDEIHRNKLRDCVYYVLQSIIPGLPTAVDNVSYVEWRPLKWLSRSDKK